MIVVTLQHPNPYFDDSYAVDSVNVGPYGRAILTELIPEIEKRYRIIRQPGRGCYRAVRPAVGKRWRSNCSIPISSVVRGPYCPDSVDFSDVEGIDIYQGPERLLQRLRVAKRADHQQPRD